MTSAQPRKPGGDGTFTVPGGGQYDHSAGSGPSASLEGPAEWIVSYRGEGPLVLADIVNPSDDDVKKMLANGADPSTPVSLSCGRCGGHGYVHGGIPAMARVDGESIGQVCFDCARRGSRYETTTLGVMARRIKGRERYAAKKEQKRLARLAGKDREESERRARRNEAAAAFTA